MRALLQENVEINEKISHFDESIFINTDSTLMKIRLDSICFIKGYGDYMQFNLDDKKYMVHVTMKELEKALPENDFYRIHKSYLVRIDKIEQIGTYHLTINGQNIPMSRNKKHDLIAYLPLVQNRLG